MAFDEADTTAEDASPQRRADSLRMALESDIVTGRFLPGDRLDEQSLADRFGVSRTPLREALAQLAQSGLVTLKPRRGAFVTSLTFHQIVERFEMMAALEAMAGGLAARRIDGEERSALLKALDDCRQEARAGDSDSYYGANERFHHVIYRASHNAYLAEEASRLHGRLKPYRRLQLKAGNRVQVSLSEHERIVEAISAGDASRAERELRDHIVVQGERLSDFLAALSRAGVM